jgi:hypothetical protein
MNTNEPARLPIATKFPRKLEILYQLLVSLTILLGILLVYGIYHMGSNATLAGALFGGLFIFLASRPSLTHVGLALSASAIVAFLHVMLGGTFGQDSGMESFSFFMGVGAFLGAGSILAMSLDRVWTGSLRYAVPLRDALILPSFTLIAGLCMQFVNARSHPSFDLFLYRFDLSLGLSPGHSVGSLFHKLPWIRTGSFFTYSGLLIFPPLYHAWASYKGKAAKIHLIHAFVIAGISGFVLYNICPAVGPHVTFGSQFPDQLPDIDKFPMKAFMSTSVYNAMPSLHITWALLVWVAAWELGSIAVVLASMIVMFTGFATVGFAEHYLIDLIVAVPLVMMVKGLCTRRHKLTAVGLGLVVAWTTFLRKGIQLPPSLDWLFVIATVGTTVFLMRSFLTTKLKAPQLTQDFASEATHCVG